MMGHDMLARVAPEFAISEAEARILAVKFCAYARHYSMFSDVDPKTRDLRLLLAAVALMEGPRIYRVVNRRSAARKAARMHATAEQQAGVSGIVADLNGFSRPV